MDRFREAPKLDWTSAAAVLSFVFVIGYRVAIYSVQTGALGLQDDAYYYFVIARNLVTTGVSTFDGQTLTNGYHPLWLLVLVLQYATIGQSHLATIMIEIFLAAAGLAFVLASLRDPSPILKIGVACLYTLLAWTMAAEGMEVSLLAFSLGLFAFVLARFTDGKASAFALGATAALCIGSRLDAAVFVIPMALLACRSVRAWIGVLIPVGLAGAGYAGVNLFVFGMPAPVSGDIKSLGGLQFNREFFQSLAVYWRTPHPFQSIAVFANSFVGRPIVLFIAVVCLAPFLNAKWNPGRCASGLSSA